MVTWDEAKRLSNIRDHGLDFVGCEVVFDGPVTTREDDRLLYGEQRINLPGWFAGQVVSMTYTERGDDFHVISRGNARPPEGSSLPLGGGGRRKAAALGAIITQGDQT